MAFMDFKEILKIISKAGKRKETIMIYYPGTETRKKGWREIEPYSLSTDIPPDGEHLIYGKDIIEPGHILNGYTIGAGDRECHSFILGKIKKTKLTKRKFIPRNNWKVEF